MTGIKQLYKLFLLFTWPFFHHIAMSEEVKLGKRLEPLTVGVILPLSGPQKDYATEALTSIQLALTQFKKEQPSFKHLISIEIADDKSTLKGATKAFYSLLERNASILIGSLSDTITLKIATLAKRHQLPLVIPSTNNRDILQIAPHIFQGSPTSSSQGNTLATFAYQTLHKKKAAILVNSESSYALEIVSSFKKKILNIGGTVLHQEHYQTATNFQQHLKHIIDHKPEMLLFPSSDIQEAATVMKMLNDTKQTFPVLGPSKWHQPKLLSLSGETAFGHYYTVPYHLHQLDTAQHHFFEEFKHKKHRLPSALAIMSYHSLLIAAHSYKKAGTTRLNELTRTLKSISISGLMGPMRMTPSKFVEHQSTMIKLTAKGRQTDTVTLF